MTITKNIDENKATFILEGRLDTNTSPILENEINMLQDIESLCLDFSGIEFISSAGLRVLLNTQKIMSNKDGMIIKNINEQIQEVFDITGFSDIFNVVG